MSQSALVRSTLTRYIRTKLRLNFLRGVRSSSGLAVAMLFARWRARGARDDDWAARSDLRECGERDIRFGASELDAIVVEGNASELDEIKVYGVPRRSLLPVCHDNTPPSTSDTIQI